LYLHELLPEDLCVIEELWEASVMRCQTLFSEKPHVLEKLH